MKLYVLPLLFASVSAGKLKKNPYDSDADVSVRALKSSGSKSKSGSCFSDEPCHVNDYASYGDVDFKDGHIRYDFRYDVKCETVARFRGCCDSTYGSGGKSCINDGGIWIADSDNAAEFSCCDPRLFEGLLNSKYCVVDGSKGHCSSSGDGCAPIRYTDQGGCLAAESGVTSGIAGCDDDKVLEIFNDAPQCV